MPKTRIDHRIFSILKNRSVVNDEFLLYNRGMDLQGESVTGGKSKKSVALILMGIKHCGKSTQGRLLSKHLPVLSTTLMTSFLR